MTKEECKALKKGDVVYYRSLFSDANNMNNAVIETPNGLHEVRLVPFHVVKVCKKVVNGHSSSARFDDLIGPAVAQAAMDRYAEVQREKSARAARVHAAVDRIERAGFSAQIHYAEVQVCADIADVASVERLADIIVTGSLAVDSWPKCALLAEVERLRALAAQAAAWRSHTEALVAAMKTWASWEDGVPSAEDCEEVGRVGAAFDAAVNALHPAADNHWRCSSCGKSVDSMNASWRWTGAIWQHTHADAPQAGHFDAVCIDAGRALGENATLECTRRPLGW